MANIVAVKAAVPSPEIDSTLSLRGIDTTSSPPASAGTSTGSVAKVPEE